MAIQLMSTGLTPEEAEARRREATARRIKILAGMTVLAVVARVLVHDPKRPPPPDYTKAPVKIVPGMLDTLPASARANLDPQLVAKMVLADEQARRGEFGKTPVPQETGPYKVADAPSEADIETEVYKEQMFAYARKRRIDAARQARIEATPIDVSKTMVVTFASGGYVRAESAEKRTKATFIRIDRTMEADIPNRWVAAIRTDGLEFQEPVPAGRVRLKPARGITVILHRDTARRISIEKTKFDES